MNTILTGIFAYFLFITPFAYGLGKYLQYNRRRQTWRAQG